MINIVIRQRQSGLVFGRNVALAQSRCAIWCHFELVEKMTMAQKPRAHWVRGEFTDPGSETA